MDGLTGYTNLFPKPNRQSTLENPQSEFRNQVDRPKTHYPIAPSISPEMIRAWECALDRLYNGLPKADFKARVKDTSVQAWDPDNLVITISAKDQDTRDWLEDLATPTTNCILVGYMASPDAAVRFVVVDYELEDGYKPTDLPSLPAKLRQ